MLTDELRRQRVLILAFIVDIPQHPWFDQMQVSQIQLVQLLRHVTEKPNRIAVRHIAPRAARTKTHGHLVAAPHRDYRSGDLHQKARTVFERTTIDIGAPVAAVLQELVE